MAKAQTIMFKNATLYGFVSLETADTKFDDKGVYHTKAYFRGEDAKAAKAVIDKAMKSNAKAKGAKKLANPPYTVEVVEDANALVVKFKMKAKIETRSGDVFEKKVSFFDSKGAAIEGKLGIAAGSKVNIAATLYGWNVASAGAGVSLQPANIQVIELVSYQKTSGSIFDTLEGGFEASEELVQDTLSDDGQAEPAEDTDEEDDDEEFDF